MDKPFWTGQDIMQALELRGVPSDFLAKGISIDTRTLRPGDLFLAIKGENFDGAHFIDQAFEKGASGVIVGENSQFVLSGPRTYLLVKDTNEALKKLGAYARSQAQGKVVAITGSAGKTTTKEWLSSVLSTFGATTSSKASFNNHWGVPLSLTNLSPQDAFGVFEVGMNNGGEIEPLTKLIQPDIAVITTIGEAHIGHMGSLDAIAEEKAQIFKGLRPGGVAILNQDNPYFSFLKNKALENGASRILGVGFSNEADVRCLKAEITEEGHSTLVTADALGKTVSFTLPFVGEHYVMNALIVLAVCETLELFTARSCAALSKLVPVQGRGASHVITLANGKSIDLIDDAYNANPSSMAAGLKVLASRAKKDQRKIAVIGSMLELGDFSQEFHQGLLPYLKENKVDKVFAVGGEMKALFDILTPEMKGEYGENPEDVISAIFEEIKGGEIVFVKGSKGSRVSRVVDFFLKTPTAEVA